MCVIDVELSGVLQVAVAQVLSSRVCVCGRNEEGRCQRGVGEAAEVHDDDWSCRVDVVAGWSRD